MTFLVDSPVVPVGFYPGEPAKEKRVVKRLSTVDDPLPLYPPTYSESIAPLKYVEGNPMTGWPVYAIQSGLKARGFDIVVDGIFGESTLNIVKRFQANNFAASQVDGIVGPATKSVLCSKVALLIDKAMPDLPDNLIDSLCTGEGGRNPSAINTSVPGGVDCGAMQIRCYIQSDGNYLLSQLTLAFDPYKSMIEAGARYLEQFNKFYNYGWYPWSKGNKLRAQRCALLAHNWPVGGGDIAFDGKITNPDSIASWVPFDPANNVYVKMIDGTVVRTRAQWCEFYADTSFEAYGAGKHCSSMAASIFWGT